jgi:translation initiation factor 2 beta subunit (eIF-2beta)/eIF-5
MTAFNKALWEAYQQLNDDDIMDAIQGSVAIPLAIKSGDWEYAFQFIRDRIENKMTRRAEFYLSSYCTTESIDDDDELRTLRTLWLKNEYRGDKDET